MTKRIIAITSIVLIFLIAIAIVFGGRTRIGLDSAEVRDSRTLHLENPYVGRVELPRSALRELALGATSVVEAESVVTAVKRLPVRLDLGDDSADVLGAGVLRGSLNRLDLNA
jgi:hypothetical protein